MREARHVYIGPQDADAEISFGEHPYPPAVVWQYFVDPDKQLRWQPTPERWSTTGFDSRVADR